MVSKLVVSTLSLLVSLPSATKWQVLSDKTERGPSNSLSMGQVSDINSSAILFQGQVGAVQGSQALVGFVIARTPFSLAANSKGLKVVIQTKDATALDLVFKSQRTGVTYQRPLDLTGGAQEITVIWSEFKAVSRGIDIPGAELLTPRMIEDFGLQVRRSRQRPELRDNPSPIGFAIMLKSIEVL